MLHELCDDHPMTFLFLSYSWVISITVAFSRAFCGLEEMLQILGFDRSKSYDTIPLSKMERYWKKGMPYDAHYFTTLGSGNTSNWMKGLSFNNN